MARIFVSLILSFLMIGNLSCQRFSESSYTGYVEVLIDSSIYRLKFGGQKRDLLSHKPKNYRILSYDVATFDDDKIYSIYDYEFGREVLLLNEKGKTKIIKVGGKFARYPSFSHNDKLIAFLSTEEDNHDKFKSDWFVYVVGRDGSNLRKVLDIAIHPSKPSWEIDNKHIILASKDLDIYSVNIQDGVFHRILENGYAPSVSRDGRFLAFLSSSDIGKYKNELKEYINFGNDEYEIIYQSSVGKEKLAKVEKLFFNSSIYVVNLDSGNTKKLTDMLNIESPVVWSPKDEFILFNEESKLNHDLIVLRVNTRKLTKLVNINGRIMYWGTEGILDTQGGRAKLTD